MRVRALWLCLFVLVLPVGSAQAERSCHPSLDCRSLPDGEYPNPETCEAFCYCTHGRSVWTNCPSGLQFNPVKKVCDWPWDADCRIEEGPHDPKTGG